MTDVTNKVDEAMDKAEDIIEEVKEEAVDMAKDVKKVVTKDEEKFRIFSFGALKYLGAGLLGASLGVVGKTIYDDRKTKRTTVTTAPVSNTIADSHTGSEEFDYSVEF